MSEPTQPPSAPRIAISFGGSSKNNNSNSGSNKNNVSNGGRNTPSRPKPPSSLGKRPRPSALGHDSDSDSDDNNGGRHEAITELGEKKAESNPKELVIARQGNRDWKSELRAKRTGGGGEKNLLPPEVQAQRDRRAGAGPGDSDNKETEPPDAEKEVQWGLTVRKTKRETSTTDEDQEEEREGGGSEKNGDGNNIGRGASPSPSEQGDDENSKPRTADDDAIDALMGKKKKSPSQQHVIGPSQHDAYHDDLARHVGADSTMDDYDAFSDQEEFGPALLRGMGWDGRMRGPKPRAGGGGGSGGDKGERRQNQLGLGAKRLKEAEDLGQWNQKGNKGKGRDSRPPKLQDYRREEERRKAERREKKGETYREEREREGDRKGERQRDRGRDRDHGRYLEYYHGRDRDRDWDRRDRDKDSHRHRGDSGRRY